MDCFPEEGSRSEMRQIRRASMSLPSHRTKSYQLFDLGGTHVMHYLLTPSHPSLPHETTHGLSSRDSEDHPSASRRFFRLLHPHFLLEGALHPMTEELSRAVGIVFQSTLKVYQRAGGML